MIVIRAGIYGGCESRFGELETEAEKFLASFIPREYDVVMAVKLLNGGRLNHVLEQMGVAYDPLLLPGREASQAARDK
jgi:hypothetical protein